MTIEERLAEIQVLADAMATAHDKATRLFTLALEVPWLLELVDIERQWSEKKSEHILILQPRVLELEERVRELEAVIKTHRDEGCSWRYIPKSLEELPDE